ncbi:aromatic amino acid exporter [Leminorella grimontii]|uniref:Aromatic amino acid exporter n=2 Tax=Leminorella grimontii TaxID=82981 RepID=A0AAV5MZD1_9GAMM|nr:drug/metabolite transporter (DMT) superfamily permease [Leminorella grimontii ATCC 33999 = DSM 5078]GKX54149.1 aromatic amino acid exporter [Leminorella grimontii]VFS59929.1 Aromatic amino acid exporter YddG [Leminorella grimontii]
MEFLPPMSARNATLIGLAAIILWSTVVGFLRSVSEGLGAIGGAAMVYSLSALLLLFIVGLPKLSSFPRKYLYWGCVLFVSYEICLSLSVGFANSGSQAIEVSMVNYLWPSLTLLFVTLADRKRPKFLMLPGMLICFAGLGKVLGGENGLSLNDMAGNVASNPLSYGLAFVGAVIWSAYCVMTKKLANGSNGITLFFMLTAAALWLKFFLTDTPAMHFSLHILVNLVLVSIAMGLGYAAWNIGMLHGNATLLATASYFTPVISALFAAMLLGESLSLYFWTGALMVCTGSLICWYSTKGAT